jgi:UDP-N-acetylmuramoyl-tripeptide--D-alanyl-D-alanine ligase
MRSRTEAPVIGFGTSAAAEVRIESLTLDPQARPKFRLVTPQGAIKVSLQLAGAHHATNAAAAAAVGLAVGLPLSEIADALGDVAELSAHRMQVTARGDGLLVVDDAYNANPESVAAALSSLAALAAGRTGSSWAVLGEMRELGPESGELHAAVGREAARLGIDHLVVVGEPAKAIAAGARSVRGWRGSVEPVADVVTAISAVSGMVSRADVVLVKASNAAALWRVAESLLAESVEVGA